MIDLLFLGLAALWRVSLEGGTTSEDSSSPPDLPIAAKRTPSGKIFRSAARLVGFRVALRRPVNALGGESFEAGTEFEVEEPVGEGRGAGEVFRLRGMDDRILCVKKGKLRYVLDPDMRTIRRCPHCNYIWRHQDECTRKSRHVAEWATESKAT